MDGRRIQLDKSYVGVVSTKVGCFGDFAGLRLGQEPECGCSDVDLVLAPESQDP